MPKDATSTRSGILAAAIQTLQHGGVEGFTLDAVASRAGVVKGLILYHYASRDRLLRTAAAQIADARTTGLGRALASASGTARAWLSLCAAGLVDRSANNAGFEGAAREALLDGCTAALATGVPLADVRDAYDALWLALLEVTEKA